MKPFKWAEGKLRRSTERDVCWDCGCSGWVSDWPGNDPYNNDCTVTVLCASARDGQLVCDDCELERRGN